MTMKPVIVFENDRIDAFDDTVRQFMSRILDMAPSTYLVTDKSTLSDFTFCGGSDLETPDEWDDWVIARVKAVYGIIIRVDMTLVDICTAIEEAKPLQ